MADPESGAQTRKHRAQTVEKALQVLDAVAESDEPLSLSALVADTGLEKTTTHRLARSLAHGGILRFDSEARSYSLGWKLIELGTLAAQRTDALSAADPHLTNLRDKTNETVHLGMYDNGEIVYLAQKASSASVVIRARVGQRRPAHCTAMGKVLLAFGPEKRITDLLEGGELQALTPNTITAKDELQSHLTRIRRLGYAVDDEEMTQGIRCVSAPVFGYTGDAVAAISLTSPAFRIPRGRLEQLTEDVCATARAVSADLGYVEPEAPVRQSDDAEPVTLHQGSTSS